MVARGVGRLRLELSLAFAFGLSHKTIHFLTYRIDECAGTSLARSECLIKRSEHKRFSCTLEQKER